MATNRVYPKGSPLSLPVPVGTKANDPVVVGIFAGVALTNRDADTGKATVALEGVFDLSVKGVDASANSAVAVGNQIYFVDADTPKLSKKNTGTAFGGALEVIASGVTDTIRVRLSN